MTIGSSQVKSLLGIKGSTNAFVESWKSVFMNIHNVKLWDTVLGISTIVVLLCLKVKYCQDLFVCFIESKFEIFLSIFDWLIATFPKILDTNSACFFFFKFVPISEPKVQKKLTWYRESIGLEEWIQKVLVAWPKCDCCYFRHVARIHFERLR